MPAYIYIVSENPESIVRIPGGTSRWARDVSKRNSDIIFSHYSAHEATPKFYFDANKLKPGQVYHIIDIQSTPLPDDERMPMDNDNKRRSTKKLEFDAIYHSRVIDGVDGVDGGTYMFEVIDHIGAGRKRRRHKKSKRVANKTKRTIKRNKKTRKRY